MTINEKMEILRMPAIGYWSVLNGLELKEIQSGVEDYVLCVDGAWSGVKTVHRLRVKYTKAGRAYIDLYSGRYFLDECIRV